MIKVFPIPCNERNIPHAGDQFLNYEFGINGWEFTTLEDADFFIAASGNENILNATKVYSKYNKPILHLHLTHMDEHQNIAFENWSQNLGDKSYIVADLIYPNNNKKYIEIVWVKNLFKDYRLNPDKPLDTSNYFYLYENYNVFLKKINLDLDSSKKTKIFLAANKTHSNRSRIRRKIVDLLMSKYFDKGFIGNADDSNYWLCDNSYDVNSVTELEEITKNNDLKTSYGQNTPHYLYYQNSFISIYGETIEGADNNNDCLIITEKTLNAILNNHFILPFSTKHFIKHLKDFHQFKFPNEINYEYDNYDDLNTRWKIYQIELKRLCELSLNDWRFIFDKNIDILNYNRNLIINIPIEKNNILERIGLS